MASLQRRRNVDCARIDDVTRCPYEPGCSRAEVFTSSNARMEASPVGM